MELRVNEITVPESISFNYEELKKEISAKTHQYKLTIYADDQIKLAKSDRATLNKLKKALNDERIRREKEYMQPFNEFKTKVNEIISIIDEPVQLIDKQIKDYDEKVKAEKKDNILACFENCTYPEWLTFEQIFDEKWLNASVKMSTIQIEILEKIRQIGMDVKTLSELPEFSFEALEVYTDTLDLNKAISEGHRLSEMAKRKSELENQQEEKAKAETVTEPVIEVQEEPEVTAVEHVETTEPTDKEWISFKALLSVDNAKALKDFFESRSIQFEAI